MPRPGSDAAVSISVFDRLIDHDPKNSQEVQPTRAQSVRILKDAVRRDLEWLLNTRMVAVPPDEKLKEVNRSVYIFGLPDFTAYSLASPADKTKLIRQLQAAIKMFEPRLARVRIVPLEVEGVVSRVLRFRIEGMLLMDPAPEHISFDTILQLSTGECEVINAG
jgi:type VI secretion system protein ImpF